jgi:hypothetical protein
MRFSFPPSTLFLTLARPDLCQRLGVHLSYWQWIWLAVAAFCSGLSKTGITGLGILPVVLFANLLPPRESTGALLPLLLCADSHLQFAWDLTYTSAATRSRVGSALCA